MDSNMENLLSSTSKYTDDDAEKIWHISNIINDVTIHV